LLIIRAVGADTWNSETAAASRSNHPALKSLSDARDCLDRALSIAVQQQARSFELRAATSLARLALLQGRRTEAKRAFSATYSSFTEGYETADLLFAGKVWGLFPEIKNERSRFAFGFWSGI
jgi:predicted ATPase